MKKWLVGLLCLGVCVVGAWGITILGWEADGQTSFGASPFVASTKAEGVSSTGLIRGSGLVTSGTSASNAWGATGWNYADAAAGVAANAFVTFTVTPDAGKSVSFSKVSINYRRSSTGPSDGVLQYSIGGAAYQDAGPFSYTSDASAGGTVSLDLAIEDVEEAITFRLVNYGASSANGSWYLRGTTDGEDLVLEGTVQDSGPPVFGISLNPSAAFEVEEGEGGSITATSRNAEGTVSYSWSCVPSSGGSASGDTFTISPTAALGAYTVTCDASDGTSTDSASVTFTVVEPSEDPDFMIDFETTWTGAATYAEKDVDFTYGGLTMNWNLTNAFRGTDTADRFNGTASLRMMIRGGGVSQIKNNLAFETPISKIAFSTAQYGTRNDVAVDVFVSEDGVDWGTAIYSEIPASTSMQEQTLVMSEPVYYVKFAPNGANQVNLDDIKLWFGAPSTDPYITYAGSTSGTAGTEMSLAFTLHNVTATSWDWDANFGSITADGAWTWTPDAAGTPTLTVSASDGTEVVATKVVNLTVVPPLQSYSITITPPVNGTLTTDPVGSALEGSTVTVTATPDSGYALEGITVNGDPISGTTFTMPSENVTVAATFTERTAVDILIDFESGTLPGSYAATSATLEDGIIWSMERVYKGSTNANDVLDGSYAARLYPQTGTNAFLEMTEPYDDAITQISFSVASFGTDNMANVTLTVAVSADGSSWDTVLTLANAAEITSTLTEHIITDVPEGMHYIRFVATAQAASGKRINIDNIGILFGEPSSEPYITQSGSTSGTVGTQMSIAFDLQNGTAASWEATVGIISSAGAWTWTPSTAGSQSLTVTAKDAGGATLATKTLTLSVTGGGGGDDPYISYTGDVSVEVGSAFSIQFALNNATALSWASEVSLAGGALQAGEGEITSDGLFTWTPAAAGSYTLDVYAYSDEAMFNEVASTSVTLTVTAAPEPELTEVEIGSLALSSGSLVATIDTVPSDAAVAVTVWGASEVNAQGGWDFGELTVDTDYTVVGKTVTVLPTADMQIICIDAAAVAD